MITTEELFIETSLCQLITSEQAWHYRIIPKSESGNEFHFYISEKNEYHDLKDELELLFGKSVEFEKTSDEVFSTAIGKYYRRGATQSIERTAKRIENISEDFLLYLIQEAKECGSSDIHIEIYEETSRVRMRIDGKLIERYILEKEEYPAYINKIKIKANIDIAEKRLPQDGRIFFNTGAEKFDIRVSVLPTLYGEKVVMRLLNKDATEIDISALGFQEKQKTDYLAQIKKPHGIILISGPTGSGKTTTLYATLKILNEIHTNIITIEDPIEYTLEGINQVQLKESIGLTFASTLRTFLRQDPDVIMLGEIRDSETAQMAIRAALTGHLVLSTVHTNSAWGTVSRLIDMDVPAFLLASTLNLSVAQRLIRLLCPDCKQKKPFGPDLIFSLKGQNILTDHHFEPKGCERCYYTGYRGRTAIYEVISIDDELTTKIKDKELSIAEYLDKEKIMTLQEAALKLFQDGKSSYEEIYPILSTSI